jgi:two-component system, NtrC family, sensor kinase
MSPEEIESIFDPGFKVYGTRVSSGNWSLFNSRQIIFEHGGDISIDSAVGKGTTVCVTLPCQ